MEPSRRIRELPLLLCWALLVAGAAGLPGCSWLPPDSPPTAPPPPDPDAELFHDWKVTGHLLGPRALISDADADGFRDRSVSVTATTYASPWSGSCDDARRDKQPRTLAEVAAAHDLDRDAAARLGIHPPIAEYRLLCATNRTPSLTIYVAGARAATCWSGVCYLLAR